VAKLFIKCYYGNQIKENEIGGGCSRHGNDNKCIQNSSQKSESKRPLGRPRHRLKGNAEVDIKEIE
jgi:hypothetical protein